MAYQVIGSGEITAGQPLTSSLGDKIRGNFVDHEDRISAVESGTNTVYQPIVLPVHGAYFIYGALERVDEFTINFDITLTGVRVISMTAGSSGTLQIDLKYKRGGGAWTSVFDTLPSVAFGAGDNASSSNAILDATDKLLEAGDIIRLDQTSVQDGGVGYLVRIDYNRT